MQEEPQLRQNEIAVQNFAGLEKCALQIDLAKRWESWGFKMHVLFKKIDADEDVMHLRSIYT